MFLAKLAAAVVFLFMVSLSTVPQTADCLKLSVAFETHESTENTQPKKLNAWGRAMESDFGKWFRNAADAPASLGDIVENRVRLSSQNWAEAKRKASRSTQKALTRFDRWFRNADAPSGTPSIKDDIRQFVSYLRSLGQRRAAAREMPAPFAEVAPLEQPLA